MATAVATTSVDRASASEIRPSETVYNDRTRDLEHCFHMLTGLNFCVRQSKPTKLMNKKLKLRETRC